jgi:hypothetical protein
MSPCPFCGLVTETPHETQEGCIRALHAEIARMREVLRHVHSTAVPRPTEPAGSDVAQPQIGPRPGPGLTPV